MSCRYEQLYTGKPLWRIYHLTRRDKIRCNGDRCFQKSRTCTSDFYSGKGLALLVSRRGANASNVPVVVASGKGKVQNVRTEDLQTALDLPPPVSMDREI